MALPHHLQISPRHGVSGIYRVLLHDNLICEAVAGHGSLDYHLEGSRWHLTAAPRNLAPTALLGAFVRSLLGRKRYRLTCDGQEVASAERLSFSTIDLGAETAIARYGLAWEKRRRCYVVRRGDEVIGTILRGGGLLGRGAQLGLKEDTPISDAVFLGCLAALQWESVSSE